MRWTMEPPPCSHLHHTTTRWILRLHQPCSHRNDDDSGDITGSIVPCFHPIHSIEPSSHPHHTIRRRCDGSCGSVEPCSHPGRCGSIGTAIPSDGNAMMGFGMRGNGGLGMGIWCGDGDGDWVGIGSPRMRGDWWLHAGNPIKTIPSEASSHHPMTWLHRIIR